MARRPARGATAQQLAHGLPIFLDQLTRTLRAEEEADEVFASTGIPGLEGGDAASLAEMGVSAAAHGKELSALGYTVDQVVHDYGDLSQTITGLAVELDTPFTVDEFRTLNRCIDNAIADAVTEFGAQHDAGIARRASAAENERLGSLVHELRNHLQTAMLAFRALESGKLAIDGSTGGVLARSLASLSAMLDKSLGQVRVAAGAASDAESFSVAGLLDEAGRAAALGAEARGCSLSVAFVDPLLEVAGDRARLLGALLNGLNNAFKFTRPNTEVALRARFEDDHVLIEVADHCGGLPAGAAATMFKPFTQAGADRTGVGLGLSIARRAVEADGGHLHVHDLPGTGCVFSISLPTIAQRHAARLA